MIQEQTKLKVIDNSGGKIVKCIKVLKGTNKKIAKLGELIKVVVKDCLYNSKIKKGQVLNAIVSRTVFFSKRNDGTYLSFNENSVILLNNNFQMIGTRIIGVLSKEIKNFFLNKSVNFSSELI
ncbi:MAG: 50S ribosomal protein L14 [Candidatus Carsonella ruddii]